MEGAEQPVTTPTSTPSGTKRRTCRSTTRSRRPRRSHWILPRSSVSSAASPGSRSRRCSRRSGGPWIPTPRRSWRCGSATSASPSWGRSSPQSPRRPAGSTGGRLGRIASGRKDRPIRPLIEQLEEPSSRRPDSVKRRRENGHRGPTSMRQRASRANFNETPPRERPSRAKFSETTSWTPSQRIWPAAGQRRAAGPSSMRRDNPRRR